MTNIQSFVIFVVFLEFGVLNDPLLYGQELI